MTTILTDAQIRALPTVPVEVVAAVAGKRIRPLGATLLMNLVGAYTNVSTNNGEVRIVESESGSVVLDGPLTDATLDDFTGMFGGTYGLGHFLCAMLFPNKINAGGGGAFPSIIGPATGFGGSLKIDITNAGNATGNFATVNAANTLEVTVLYTLIDA